MAVRKIVKIDEEKCNGCGECIINCPEGALKIIDGKAKLVKESYCDGLGACIGNCPLGAITVEEREAEEFDEAAANANMEAAEKAPGCPGSDLHSMNHVGGGCPGSAMRNLAGGTSAPVNVGDEKSCLAHWPVQLSLVPPAAPFLKGAQVLLVADCVPFAYAGFHKKFLAGGHPVLVACPRLDNTEPYVEKLTEMFKVAGISKLVVVHMEVPCCGGLGRIVAVAMQNSGADIPVEDITVSIEGEII